MDYSHMPEHVDRKKSIESQADKDKYSLEYFVLLDMCYLVRIYYQHMDLCRFHIDFQYKLVGIYKRTSLFFV